MRTLLIGLVALVVGCEPNVDPNEWAQCEEDGPVFHTRTDPNHCGGCYVQCEAGVPCDDWACQYNTPLHCGAPHRQCVAPDGHGVACVDAEQVSAELELINGFACEPSLRAPSDDLEPMIDPEPEGPEGPEGPTSQPVERSPWIGIPGHSQQCHSGLDDRLCQQATVEFADLCGRDVMQPLAYDFEIMTTEVSRGQYRAAMCGDCAPPQTLLCQSLCDDLGADDVEERDARPITGLNWCEAYTVCQELGGRLPTVQERARVEALAYGSRALFRQVTSCTGWTRETGRPPWLSECFDEPPDALGLDRVDGLSGHVLLGVGVLRVPQLVHHLVGNVDEWLADPAEALTTGALLDGPRWWGVANDDDEFSRARIIRGRSVHSPAGQPGNRTLIVDPSLKAGDVGVRCARTTLSPYDEPVPYPFEASADRHARCVNAEVAGLRPVRQMNGQQVYRATAACVDAPLPSDTHASLSADLGRLLMGEDVALARLTQVTGELVGMGLARFTTDEQWWLHEPAKLNGPTLRVVEDRIPDGVPWRGESTRIGETCREQMSGVANRASDGHLQRRQTLVLTRRDLQRVSLTATGDIGEFACDAFDCATEFEGRCATGCDAWLIPVAVAFDRAEPFDRSVMCDASTSNPAER